MEVNLLWLLLMVLGLGGLWAAYRWLRRQADAHTILVRTWAAHIADLCYSTKDEDRNRSARSLIEVTLLALTRAPLGTRLDETAPNEFALLPLWSPALVYPSPQPFDETETKSLLGRFLMGLETLAPSDQWDAPLTAHRLTTLALHVASVAPAKEAKRIHEEVKRFLLEIRDLPDQTGLASGVGARYVCTYPSPEKRRVAELWENTQAQGRDGSVVYRVPIEKIDGSPGQPLLKGLEGPAILPRRSWFKRLLTRYWESLGRRVEALFWVAAILLAVACVGAVVTNLATHRTHEKPITAPD